MQVVNAAGHNLTFFETLQVTREYTAKVDKLEQNEAKREQEGESEQPASMIMPEPQLMLTAGPGMGMPPQYAGGYGGAPGYAPNMPYQGYGGM